MNRLHELYKKEIVPKLMKELNLSNVMAIPNLKKISVNAGIGDFRDNKEAVDAFVEELSDLCGQRVHFRKARLSEAGFKVRKGDVVGVSVTLRGERMWAFFDKLVNIVLPRVRDFRGVSTEAFDEAGNYSIGIEEHTIFPEINPNKVKGTRGLQVTIVTTAKDKKSGKLLLEKLGTPFREK